MDKSLIIYYVTGIVSVLGVSFITYSIYTRYDLKFSSRVLYLLFICSIYMFFAQIMKYNSLHFYSDFSHWTNLLNNIIMDGKPYSPHHELMHPGTRNYLSVHFLPLIYVIAIPFKLLPYSETLIATNFVLMVSAGIPLYKLAALYQRGRTFPLLMVVLLYWYAPFQYITTYEFEMLRFSIPILFWMLYYWEKKKMTPFYLFVVLAILVREEMGLVIFMFGIYLIFFEKQRRAGLITSVAGMAAFYVISQIIMPALRGSSEYHHIAMGSFSSLGNSMGEIIKNIITNPLFVLSTILEPNANLLIKSANIFMFFLPLLFVSLLAPAALTPVLVNYGIGFISGSLTHISYMMFYTSPSIPFVFYAFIKGWPNFIILLKRFNKKIFRVVEDVTVTSGAMAMVLTGLLVSNIFFSPSPISLQFWFKNLRPAPFETQNHHYSAYIVTDHHKKVNKFVEMIPDHAIIASPSFFAPRLFKKAGIVDLTPRESSINRLNIIKDKYMVDYVLLDKESDNLRNWRFSFTTQNVLKYIETHRQSWELIKSDDGYLLYKRKYEFANRTTARH